MSAPDLDAQLSPEHRWVIDAAARFRGLSASLDNVPLCTIAELAELGLIQSVGDEAIFDSDGTMLALDRWELTEAGHRLAESLGGPA